MAEGLVNQGSAANHPPTGKLILQRQPLPGKRHEVADALAQIRKTAKDPAELHDMKVRFLEQNDELPGDLLAEDPGIPASQPAADERPPPRPRSEFATEAEWELYQSHREFTDALAQIRNTAKDPAELHEMKALFLEENDAFLRDLFARATGTPASQPPPDENPPSRPRSDFVTEEEWELYQREKEAAGALRQIRKAAKDPAELHEMKIFFLDENEDLINELEAKRATLNARKNDPELRTN